MCFVFFVSVVPLSAYLRFLFLLYTIFVFGNRPSDHPPACRSMLILMYGQYLHIRKLSLFTVHYCWRTRLFIGTLLVFVFKSIQNMNNVTHSFTKCTCARAQTSQQNMSHFGLDYECMGYIGQPNNATVSQQLDNTLIYLYIYAKCIHLRTYMHQNCKCPIPDIWTSYTTERTGLMDWGISRHISLEPKAKRNVQIDKR